MIHYNDSFFVSFFPLKVCNRFLHLTLLGLERERETPIPVIEHSENKIIISNKNEVRPGVFKLSVP